MAIQWASIAQNGGFFRKFKLENSQLKNFKQTKASNWPFLSFKIHQTKRSRNSQTLVFAFLNSWNRSYFSAVTLPLHCRYSAATLPSTKISNNPPLATRTPTATTQISTRIHSARTVACGRSITSSTIANWSEWFSSIVRFKGKRLEQNESELLMDRWKLFQWRGELSWWGYSIR